jgi:tellurite resistance-related uncharacterized protein
MPNIVKKNQMPLLCNESHPKTVTEKKNTETIGKWKEINIVAQHVRRTKKITLLENVSWVVKYEWSLRMPHSVHDQLAPLTGYERISQ